MIVLFLGSWRSTLVVMISIPLSILSSLVVLYFLGDTINTMTLGGLALAIGILVDDSTVTIENTHRLLTEERMPLPAATLYGAAGIAVPTLVSTLAISCVFVSVVFLHGPAKYLFTPLGLAVVFAMLASYGLSRTLTPITIGLLLKGEHHGEDGQGSSGWFGRLHQKFEHGFETMRSRYVEVLHTLLRRRLIVPLGAAVVLALGGTLFMFVGRDFFPIIDGGQIQLHVRAPPGTRIEKTEQVFQAVEDRIREVIPEQDRDLIVDNIGLPARSYNFAFGDGTATGLNDGVILVALKEDHAPTASYIAKLRQVLPAAFPEDIFYFQAADMVTQILNFGIPAQINVRAVGYDRAKNLQVAKQLQKRMAAIPGLADVHLQQEVNAPELFAQIDRARATQFGLTANSIALNLKHQPELVRASFAELLDRSEQRNSLLPCGANARISRLLAQRDQEHAGDHVHRTRPQSRARSPQQCGHHQARTQLRPTPIKRTCNPFTKSMPMPKAAISARYPAT